MGLWQPLMDYLRTRFVDLSEQAVHKGGLSRACSLPVDRIRPMERSIRGAVLRRLPAQGQSPPQFPSDSSGCCRPRRFQFDLSS